MEPVEVKQPDWNVTSFDPGEIENCEFKDVPRCVHLPVLFIHDLFYNTTDECITYSVVEW